ncbi:esterase [Paenibacillus ihbetae]|uniref:Esterase n=1 Tax=Paenibacillus ihbetae TaxID=1870820 RepID=A0A1B2E3S6_9BACL|nr:alpha/beta hydrolase-fold protein [Paenibacillus ihbetae]ANY74609.1 esterase [Paenibacillus ihbetae]
MNRYQKLSALDRELTLYLPPSYDESDRCYPVAYVQDGGDSFMDCLNYLEHLFKDGRLRELILVGIATENRNDEYTPWPAKPLLEGRPPFGGRGREYVDEVADRIKPYIDSCYRTRPEPEHTGIIGASFGGLISMLAGYWRPDTFGRIGMLSASLWYEGVMEFIREHGKLPPGLRVYMSVGQYEGAYKQGIQKHMTPSNLEAFRIWSGEEGAESRVKLHMDPDGTHDPIFMSRRFPDAVSWLFDENGSGAVKPRAAAEHDASTAGQAVAAEGIRGIPETVGPAYRISGTVTWSMRSESNGRAYRISVAEPMGPPPEGGYPVLYSLDANASFGTLAEAVRLQSRTPRGITPSIIVGIGYESDSPIVTDERFYDYTVPAAAHELPVRPNGMPWPETGGADDFLDFIELQLIPRVASQYPVNPGKQSVFGHSLGGFFVLYALFTRPHVFRRYIAASPSVWWKQHVLYKTWEVTKLFFRPLDFQRKLSIFVGTEEKPSMVQDARDLYAKLREHKDLLQAELHEIEGEGHVSVLPSLVSPLLRLISSY